MRSFRTDGDGRAWPGWRRALAVFICGSLGTASVAGLPMQRAAAQGTPPPPTASPVAVTPAPGQERLSQAQLEQLLAPIALHPDTLLTQMLMASTYPLEIVQAKRWRDRNPNVAGSALEQALLDQPWDASVKSLVPFPDVLTLMNDQLEWTQQVGDAVLAQQQDVFSAIQVLRGRAQANGALQSGPQQTVTVTQNVTTPPAPGVAAPTVAPPPQVITIAPTQPETVYLPAYDPNQVYGTWPYPQSPPYSYPPPVGWGLGSALLTGMAFAGGAAIVGGLWGWGSANWGSGDISINADRVNNINRNVNRGDRTTSIGSGNRWQHDTTHRQGVAYRGDDVRNRYQGDRRQQADAREQFRGRTQQPGGAFTGGDRPGGGQVQRPGAGDRPGAGTRPGGADRPGAGARPGGADRPGASTRPAGGERPGAGARPGGGDRAGAAQRPGGGDRVAASGRPQVSPQRDFGGGGGGAQGFQGMGDGGRERAAAQRGAASRQSAGFQSGGGGRGGGAAAARGGGGGGGRAAGGGGGRGGRR